VNLFFFRIWQQYSNYVFRISEVIEENYSFIAETPKRKPLLGTELAGRLRKVASKSLGLS